MDGKLIIFSAPSGSGKTTIVKKILSDNDQLEFSISAASRAMRPGETDGKDYYFLSADEFRDKIQQNLFLEWEEVYPGQYYGTLYSEIQRIWEKGKHVVFDIDVKGGLNIKKQYGDKALSIFIKAPSLEELATRLKSRGTETPELIAMRVQKANEETAFANHFDKIIVNDNLDKAVAETKQIIKNFISN